MASAAVRSKAPVLLLFIHCLLLLPLLVRSSFCFAVLCVLSTFEIVTLGKREVVALICL